MTFFILGLLALALGLGNLAGISIEIGRGLLLFFVFMAMVTFLASLFSSLSRRDSRRRW